jgi:hypothetical protein
VAGQPRSLTFDVGGLVSSLLSVTSFVVALKVALNRASAQLHLIAHDRTASVVISVISACTVL